MEKLNQFIVSRTKPTSTVTYTNPDARKSLKVFYFILTIKELSNQLTSTQNNLSISNLCTPAWERYKERLVYILHILLMLLCVFLMFYCKVWWWVGLVGLLGVLLSAYFFYSGVFLNWIYTFYLKLRLKLWTIPPAAPDDDILNPRCIFVSWNKSSESTWAKWLNANILPKLQSELGITDIKELDILIKNADNSSNEFQKYSLSSDMVMGPLNYVPLLYLYLLAIFIFVIAIPGALIYHKWYQTAAFCPVALAVIKIVYGLFKPNKENVDPDVEANVNILDVICRLHRVIKKETIFFVVANKYDDLKEIPDGYRKYFKLLIISDVPISDDYYSVLFTNNFNMDWSVYDTDMTTIRQLIESKKARLRKETRRRKRVIV